jgi:hypothetical protein
MGAAVNVTLVPAQIAPEGTAEILTLAGRSGFTLMVTKLDVAGEPDAQDAFDVITTVITSPFARVEEV